MAIRWQIPFRTLRSNSLLTVNVYDNSYNGSPTQLTGGAQPFVTEEDDDDDWFAPVRTQSGYLSIVDTGKDNDGNPFNWRDFIPTTDTDRPVTLTDEQGTILWQGFMQAQNFGSQLYEIPQERQFPVQCVLTVLSSKEITSGTKMMRNFATMLGDIISAIPTLKITNVVIQGGTDAQDWLQKIVDLQLFFDEDEDGNLIAKYTQFEILEEICKYWGWTARTDRQTLSLMRVDDAPHQSILTLTIAQLAVIAMGGTDGTTGGNLSTIAIGNNFASTNNNDEQMRGPGKAEVTADAGVANENVVEIYPENVSADMIRDGFDTIFGAENCYTYDKTSFSSAFFSGTCTSEASFNILYLYKFDLYNEKNNFIPVIRIKSAYNGGRKAYLETSFYHSFVGGMFVLKAKIYKDKEIFEDSTTTPHDTYGNKKMRMKLGFGKTRNSCVWYDGYNKWVSKETEFYARIGSTDDILYTASLDAPLGANKKIPSPNTYNFLQKSIDEGKLFIEFLGSDDIDNNLDKCVFDIADFSLQYENNEDILILGVCINPAITNRNSYTYKANNENSKFDVFSIDTIFATFNSMNYGYGIVRNPDYTYYSSALGIAILPPEQLLANRVVNYWATSKRKIECELKTDEVEQSAPITPQDLLTIDGTTMWPIAISHEWRDDVTRITAMETYKR